MEQRLDRAGIFEAILTMMQALRGDKQMATSTAKPHSTSQARETGSNSISVQDCEAVQKRDADAKNLLTENPLTEQREAYMRECIRNA